MFQLHRPWLRNFVLLVNGTNGHLLGVNRSGIDIAGSFLQNSSETIAAEFVVAIADVNLTSIMKIRLGACQRIVGLTSSPPCGDVPVNVVIVNGLSVLVSGAVIFVVLLAVGLWFVARIVRHNWRLKASVSASHTFVLNRDPTVRVFPFAVNFQF